MWQSFSVYFDILRYWATVLMTHSLQRNVTIQMVQAIKVCTLCEVKESIFHTAGFSWKCMVVSILVFDLILLLCERGLKVTTETEQVWRDSRHKNSAIIITLMSLQNVMHLFPGLQCWFPTFFRISSFVFCIRNKCLQVCIRGWHFFGETKSLLIMWLGRYRKCQMAWAGIVNNTMIPNFIHTHTV